MTAPDTELITAATWPPWTNLLGQQPRGPLVNFRASKKDKAAPWCQQNAEGEWLEQIQPSDQQLADEVNTLIEHLDVAVINYLGAGNKIFVVDGEGIASPGGRENLPPALFKLLTAMMGGMHPTTKTLNSAIQHVLSLPRPSGELSTIRWEGEHKLALRELPLPREGDWSAHKEFVDRCSCPDTLMAWVWTCFLPEDQTGREALLLWGPGNDGKSYWSETLVRFLGNAATPSEILKGENRFELANLIDKRLIYFGDFRNPRPIHSKIMREIIAGAFLSLERKGRDMEQAYLHPRCLFTTNVEPRILVTDRAEFTRIRRINVRPLEDNRGDLGWKLRLSQQMPAFLWACREVYNRFATAGKDLPITEACRTALAGGSRAVEEEFDFLAERLEITGNEEHIVTAKRMVDLFELARYKGWERANARQWLRAAGANNVDPKGLKHTKKISGKAVAVWRGVRELSSAPFRDIASAQEAA